MRTKMFRAFIGFGLCFILLSGCGESPQQKYDAAVRELERSQERLDSLRPAYDAARQTAANAVCREIAGTTPEESASAALQGLGNVLNETSPPPSGAPGADAKKAEDGKKAVGGRKSDDLDKTIDNLISAEKNVQEKQAALGAPIAKANEVMTKIRTPGTPEAKKYEAKLASMPEAQAYERQQKRVEAAQKDVDEAKTALGK
jgi:hypothetical protein